MRRVEDHRDITGFAQTRKAAHVHHQITVPEKRAAFGDGQRARFHRRECCTGFNFAHGSAHAFGMHPLPLLHVHGFPRRPGRE